jgi:betaine lipid synthase
MKYLNLTEKDSMLVITSAGDNALHYAIAAQPKRVGAVYFFSVRRIELLNLKIHCVDTNPW